MTADDSVLVTLPSVRFRWWAKPVMAVVATLSAVVLRFGMRSSG
jgi:hypothetical protein